MSDIHLIGFCGSLRQDSFNRKILEFAQAHMPTGSELEIVEIGHLPFFNQDLEAEPPQTVKDLRAKMAAADGILFSLAEYNYSVSAVLKNAVEWGSRPYANAVLNGKTVAIMGASNGQIGTARAQYHFRQMCVQIDMHPLNKPEVMVSFAQDKFDVQGNLTDEKTQQKIIELVTALVAAIT